MATESEHVRYPKLNSENWFSWKVHTKAQCMRFECWEGVLGYEVEHSENENGEGVEATVTPEEQRRRTRLDNKAQSIIISSVGDEFLDDLDDCENAKDMWNTLKGLCTSYGLLQEIIFFRELFQGEKDENTTMQTYLSRIQDLVKKIGKCGLVLPDRVVASFFLIGLPMEKYEGVIRTIEVDPEGRTSKNVKTKLLLEEKRMKHNENIHTTETHKALKTQKVVKHTNVKQINQPKTKEDRTPTPNHQHAERKYTCFACGGEGHVMKFCPKVKERKAQERVKQNRASENKNAQATVVTRPYHALCAQKNDNTKGNEGVWLIDSAASDHMTHRRDLMEDFVPMSGEVLVGDGSPLQIEGKGSVLLHISSECGGFDLKFKEVLYVPQLKDNLISLGALDEKGLMITSHNGILNVCDADNPKPLLKAHRVGRLYVVTTENGESINYLRGQFKSESTRTVSKVSFKMWHERLGHAHTEAIKKMSIIKENSTDLQLTEDCISCIKGKMKKLKFPEEKRLKTSQPLQRIHSDVAGPIHPQSLGKNKYYVTFLDDFTNYIYVEPLSLKSQVGEAFRKFQSRAELIMGSKVQEIQSDRGGEYLAGRLQKHLQDCGILHRMSVPNRPQQNGKAERMNLTLQTTVRCLLDHSGMPHYFWAEALDTAAHVRNLVPSAAVDGQIPWELWNKRKLQIEDIQHLRTFGCQAWAIVDNGGKLDDRAEECVLLGFPSGTKGYRLWSLKNRKIIVRRDVIVRESVFPFKRINTAENVTLRDMAVFSVEQPDQEEESIQSGAQERPDLGEDPDQGYVQEHPDPGEEHPGLRRSNRPPKPKGPCPCCHVTVQQVPIPKNWKEATTGVNSEKWRLAMEEELGNMELLEAWELIKRPDFTNVLGSKWVYAVKHDRDGHIKFKARLVAQGYRQVEGIDYMETFSPVISMKNIRLLLALATLNEWEIHQMDFVSAYLNSPIDVPIYMEQPPGFEIGDKSAKDIVCKLRKSLYGLKQSGKNWNEHLHESLTNMGFYRCKNEPCIYRKESLILGVYVDDILIVGIGKEIEKFKKDIQERMRVKDLGVASKLLSFNIRKINANELFINQIDYVNYVLEEFNMSDCKGVSTPLNPGTVFLDEDNVERFDSSLYRKAIGCLLFIANGSRPDIANAVCKMSQKCESPTTKDWSNVKHVLRYLQKTKDLGIMLSTDGGKLTVYCDADWASDKRDAKSITGYVLMLAGSPIIWKSRKQKSVATSTSHAEYISMYETAIETVWLNDLLVELDQIQIVKKPTEINADNKSAISIAENSSINDRSRHFSAKYHYVRELVCSGEIEFKFVESNDNVADLLTKLLTGPKTKHFCDRMGLKDMPYF